MKFPTIYDVFKKELEQECHAQGVSFTRKNKGLRLNLFGSPEIYPTETHIRIQTLSSTGQFGKRYYHTLILNIGDPLDPKTDPMVTLNKVKQIIQKYKEIHTLSDEFTCG